MTNIVPKIDYMITFFEIIFQEIQELRFFDKIRKQALLGGPHSRIQVELDFIFQSGTFQILNFA